jgi:zinc transporter ZupT
VRVGGDKAAALGNATATVTATGGGADEVSWHHDHDSLGPTINKSDDRPSTRTALMSAARLEKIVSLVSLAVDSPLPAPLQSELAACCQSDFHSHEVLVLPATGTEAPGAHTAKAYVLTAGLTFHSIFEGLAIALTSEPGGGCDAGMGKAMMRAVG